MFFTGFISDTAVFPNNVVTLIFMPSTTSSVARVYTTSSTFFIVSFAKRVIPMLFSVFELSFLLYTVIFTLEFLLSKDFDNIAEALIFNSAPFDTSFIRYCFCSPDNSIMIELLSEEIFLISKPLLYNITVFCNINLSISSGKLIFIIGLLNKLHEASFANSVTVKVILF
ncbi:hypothetical protein D3C72_1475400 [compost metagenome]